MTGIYNGESITDELEAYLNQFEELRPVADGLAVTIILITITKAVIKVAKNEQQIFGIGYLVVRANLQKLVVCCKA